MSHVLLIRHGQTDANAAGVIQGQLPTSLNDLGRAQALCVARALQARRPPVIRLLSSPLPRAVETARLIGETLGLAVGIDDRWAERHFGSLQGQPSDIRRVMTHGGTSAETDDAEPKAVFDRRVAAALQELGVPGDDVTAVVSHGGVIGSVVRQLMSGVLPCVNPPPERRPVPNGSIFHLEWTPSAWVVRAYFDVGHLGGLVSVLDAG